MLGSLDPCRSAIQRSYSCSYTSQPPTLEAREEPAQSMQPQLGRHDSYNEPNDVFFFAGSRVHARYLLWVFGVLGRARAQNI